VLGIASKSNEKKLFACSKCVYRFILTCTYLIDHFEYRFGGIFHGRKYTVV